MVMHSLLRPGLLALVAGVCVYCALSVHSAPLSSPAAESDADSLLLAIQAVNRARRESAKGKGTQSARSSLVRYRYPIHIKRSPLDADVGGPLEDDAVDGNVDLSQLAQAIVLDLLVEGDEQNRLSRSHPAAGEADKRKKKSEIVRVADDDNDKKKKRMNSFLDQMMEQEAEELDNERMNEEDDEAGDVPDQLFGAGDDDDLTDEDEQAIYESIIQALSDEGVDDAQLQALLPQSDEFKSGDRKRSAEWKKLPRASARWRSRFENDVIAGRQKADPEELEPWKSLSEKIKLILEGKVYGKGFHRGLRGMRDESRMAASKSDQSSWTPRNAGEIHKRSVSSGSHQQDEHSSSNEKQSKEAGHGALSRKRRSVPQVEDISSEKTPSTEMKAPSVDTKTSDYINDQAVGATLNTTDKADESKSATHANNIRKKSVDWDDYFGYDKRSDDSNGDFKDWLESEYYKTIAASLSSRRKRVPHALHDSMIRKRSNVTFWNKRQADPVAQDEDDTLSDADRFKAVAIGNLIDQLGEEGLDKISRDLRHKIALALQEEEDEQLMHNLQELMEEEDDDRDPRKRSPYLPPMARVASSKGHVKETIRRKRYPLNTFSRSQPRRMSSMSDEPIPKGTLIVSMSAAGFWF